jgi:hypothetical protein
MKKLLLFVGPTLILLSLLFRHRKKALPASYCRWVQGLPDARRLCGSERRQEMQLSPMSVPPVLAATTSEHRLQEVVPRVEWAAHEKYGAKAGRWLECSYRRWVSWSGRIGREEDYINMRKNGRSNYGHMPVSRHLGRTSDDILLEQITP